MPRDSEESTVREYPIFVLCGGFGTRLKGETEARPKPMVPIRGQPIVLHIMRTYAHHGFRRFGELKMDGDGVVEFEEKWASTAKKLAPFGSVHREPA